MCQHKSELKGVKEMLSKYWADHRDELKSMLDVNDPRLKEENPLP
jgi:hypothetical protein